MVINDLSLTSTAAAIFSLLLYGLTPVSGHLLSLINEPIKGHSMIPGVLLPEWLLAGPDPRVGDCTGAVPQIFLLAHQFTFRSPVYLHKS